MATITDLAEQVSAQVTDNDLLLTHQPTGASYTGKSVKRSAFLHDVVRTGSDADLNSLTVTGAVSADAADVNDMTVAGVLTIGADIQRVLLSAAVTDSVSAAAGADDAITVPLAGALAGDFVVVHASGLTAGVTASGVASADTVTVTIFNATASPFSGSVTVKALAIRAD